MAKALRWLLVLVALVVALLVIGLVVFGVGEDQPGGLVVGAFGVPVEPVRRARARRRARRPRPGGG
jgi:hypothetical protein